MNLNWLAVSSFARCGIMAAALTASVASFRRTPVALAPPIRPAKIDPCVLSTFAVQPCVLGDTIQVGQRGRSVLVARNSGNVDLSLTISCVAAGVVMDCAIDNPSPTLTAGSSAPFVATYTASSAGVGSIAIAVRDGSGREIDPSLQITVAATASSTPSGGGH